MAALQELFERQFAIVVRYVLPRNAYGVIVEQYRRA